MIPKPVAAAIDHLTQLHEELNYKRRGHGIEPCTMFWDKDGKLALMIRCRPPIDAEDHDRSFMEMFSAIHVVQAEHVLFCADSWFKVATQEEMENLTPPSLSPDRVEALNFVYATREVVTFTTWTMPYVRDDKGSIYWIKASGMEAEEKSNMEGLIADGLNHFFNVDGEAPVDINDFCDHLAIMGHWPYRFSDVGTILDHLDW